MATPFFRGALFSFGQTWHVTQPHQSQLLRTLLRDKHLTQAGILLWNVKHWGGVRIALLWGPQKLTLHTWNCRLPLLYPFFDLPFGGNQPVIGEDKANAQKRTRIETSDQSGGPGKPFQPRTAKSHNTTHASASLSCFGYLLPGEIGLI